MRWRGLLGASSVAMMLSACGLLPGSAPTATPPTPAPSVAPAPSAPPNPTKPQVAATASPAPVAKPTATTAAPAAAADTVWVGNTDGEGVYLRKTPAMADRLKPYPDGTALTIVGADVDGDGQHWKHVKTPDGLEGYVPSIYTVATPP